MDLIEDFLREEDISTTTKVEDYLLVYLGLRPCSIVTIPAEFIDSEKVGRAIDERVYPRFSRLSSFREPKKKLLEIDRIKEDLRVAFRELVQNSKQYKKHIEWAAALGLHIFEAEVRPTVHELYIFKDPSLKEKIRRLMDERERLREKVRREVTPNTTTTQLAYPEEFSYEYTKAMGALLGYPECCVEEYAAERRRNRSVEERSARQIEELRRTGEEIETFPYMVSYFFPCSPSCSNARAKGLTFYQHLAATHSPLAEIYSRCLENNLNKVLSQPEIIREYLRKGVQIS